MKINLKFGQKQESVSTGLQVITNLRVGWCGCGKDGNHWICSDEAGQQTFHLSEEVDGWRSQHNCPINIPFDDSIN
jgi:hypothetical protein